MVRMWVYGIAGSLLVLVVAIAFDVVRHLKEK
jgi:hypothetical protein